MKKYFILFAICLIFVVNCSACTTAKNAVCPPEEGLTQAECNNSGTHTYKSSRETHGIGGMDCSENDVIPFRGDDETDTFTFFEGEGVMYEHPDDLVWDSNIQPFMKTDKNQYIFLGAEGDILRTWEVEFFTWGFTEKMTATWECGDDICGCVMNAENELAD